LFEGFEEFELFELFELFEGRELRLFEFCAFNARSVDGDNCVMNF
jgi:hypothetical protein